MRLMEAAEGFNVSEEDMERVFKIVDKRELDKKDINGLANELVDDGEFSRSPGSAEFVISRMHILIHGIAPYGFTERSAETMFRAAKPLIDFMQRKGYDVEENTRKARIDLKNRVVKIKQSEAMQRMTNYFQQHKELMNGPTRQLLRANRNKIIADIMAGESEEDTFRNHGWTKNKGGTTNTPKDTTMESTGLLKELITKNDFDVQATADRLAKYASIVEGFIDQMEVLCENDAPTRSMEEALDTVIKQMEAAKRGLGLVNKLTPGPSKAKHASRIMGNMNRIRANIRRIERSLTTLAQDSDRNHVSSESEPASGSTMGMGSMSTMGLRGSGIGDPTAG